jgi:formylglycine-generating enzyme required for sulfatase activity
METNKERGTTMGRILILVLAGFLLIVATAAYATKVCPNCGREYPDDYNFCEECIPPTRLVGGETMAGLPAGMKLISIPGGTFSMGSTASDADSNESPVHTVTISGFKMSETEVTVDQYVEFLNEVTPSSLDRKKWIETNDEDSRSHIYYTGGKYYADGGWGDHPAVNVSWYGAEAFCEHYGLRLPTQAEWMYAAGGPSHYNYPWGDSFNGSKCCWYENKGSGDPSTKPVKSFDANGYGLYDMAGNVWEWCFDWYDEDYYSKLPSKNPQGPSIGIYKILRGGSWLDFAQTIRCANRIGNNPERLDYDYGFRAAGD